MAEDDNNQEKTEEPTQKKIEDARQKGQVVTSKEVNTFFSLVAALIFAWMLLPSFLYDIASILKNFFSHVHDIQIDDISFTQILWTLLKAVFYVFLIPLILFVAFAIGSNVIQHGMPFSFETIKPSFGKISPLAGAKRLFSVRSLTEFFKGLIKLALVTLLCYVVVYADMETLFSSYMKPVASVYSEVFYAILKILLVCTIFMGIIAVLDFYYQQYEYLKKLRMTKQEIKDEMKQTEGDPHVKARIDRIRKERARQRMMAAVPDSDVIITNPTHFSIALRYKQDDMNAPKVVAKGQDLMALRIREIAKEHNIPLVENKPLARALYASVEIDDEIPEEHFKAVAEIISYVWKLKNKY